jgi:hypothetical protein
MYLNSTYAYLFMSDNELLGHTVYRIPNQEIINVMYRYVSGMAMIPPTLGARCDSCPQCIIFSPICATYHTQFATNNRRGFSSECHMHCYNRCHGTSTLILFLSFSRLEFNLQLVQSTLIYRVSQKYVYTQG